MVGNHGLASQPAIIDAAVAGGVCEFYPSEFGADIDVGPYLSTRYFRDKLITRKHLEETAQKTPGFRYTYMLVGAITEYLATPFLGVDTEKHTFTFYGAPEMKAAFTSINEYGPQSVGLGSTLTPPAAALQGILWSQLCCPDPPSLSDGSGVSEAPTRGRISSK